MSTPLRRSRRGQQPSQPEQGSSAHAIVHTRAVKVSHDLTTEQWNSLLETDTDIKTVQTHFLEAYFTPLSDLPSFKKLTKSKSKVPSPGDDALRVGDTVLLDTPIPNREPNVAVITGIWKVTKDENEFCVNVGVHWFMRPNQLPTIRAKREHEQNEVYYQLSDGEVLPIKSVLGRCIVSSRKSPKAKTKAGDLLCLYAINQSKGLFYDFSWEDHRTDALTIGRYWEVGQAAVWDVRPINVPETPKKGRSGGGTPIKKGRGISRTGLLDVVEEEGEEDEGRGKKRRRIRRDDEHESLDGEGEGGNDRNDTEREEEGEAEDILPAPKQLRTSGAAKRRPLPNIHSHARSRSNTNYKDDDTDSSLSSVGSDTYHDSSEGADDGEDVEEEDVEFDVVPRTPSKRRGVGTPRKTRKSSTSTPRRQQGRTRKTLVAPTPHSKAALRARRKKMFAVLPSHSLGPGPRREEDDEGEDRREDAQEEFKSVQRDAWLRAMHALHVGSNSRSSEEGSSQEKGHGTGDSGSKRARGVLPCREEEYARILGAVEELVEEGSGGCVYISGVPGTGKTATVHAVVRELKRMAERNETNPFTYVEINGLRIPDPGAAYNLLWEGLSGHDVAREGHLRVSSGEALKRLERYFAGVKGRGPGGFACVVLMDELDQLMTQKQDVVYNFFNWPTLVGSKLVVLAVANTMDLPERVMTGRVRSRLGMVRINFQPYTTPQLEAIVHARLERAKASLQVAKGEDKDGEEEDMSGKEVIARDGVRFAAMKVSSISGDARRVLDICRRAVELVQPHGRTARTEDVKRVIVDMQNSPMAGYLRELSFHERVMLVAVLRVVKRGGVDEVKWGDVTRQHVLHVPLLSPSSSSSTITRIPTPGELGMVLDSLVATHAVLCEEGTVVGRKSEDERRVVLNVEYAEVERVLGEVGGIKWRNAMNV